MLALMMPHVDEFKRHLGALKGSLAHRLGLACERKDRTIRACAGVDVQQFDAFDLPDRSRNRIENRPVLAFTEIGHTLDDPRVHRPVSIRKARAGLP